MAKHNITGKMGEEMAKEFLILNDYQILELNWRTGKAEIDIIAKDKEILVFVEVKTRGSELFGTPESSVDAKKQRLVADAAALYMEKIGHDWEIRFDIISIVKIENGRHKINHFKEAFFPGL